MNGAEDWWPPGVGLVPFAGLAGLARGATSKPNSMAPARRELERAVRTGFAPGLVGLIAGGDNVDVMAVGRMAIDGPPMQRDTIFRIASIGLRTDVAVEHRHSRAEAELKLTHRRN